MSHPSINHPFLPKTDQALAECIEQAGIKDNGFKKFMMGTGAAH